MSVERLKPYQGSEPAEAARSAKKGQPPVVAIVRQSKKAACSPLPIESGLWLLLGLEKPAIVILVFGRE